MMVVYIVPICCESTGSDACDGVKCQHDGTCIPAKHGFICVCPMEVEGTHCEILRDAGMFQIMLIRWQK